jgi:outer membrane protein
MKTYFGKLMAGALLFVCCSLPALGQSRLATVSVQKVFENYWKTKQGGATLKERMTEIEKATKDMLEDFKKAKDEYQKLLESANDQAVSAPEREKRKKSADDKLSELKRMEDGIAEYRRGAISRLNEQTAQMRKRIFDEIKQVITSKAKSSGYALVIDSDAATLVPDPAGPYATPTVLYTNGDNDLTEPVLTQLNATAPIDISKPEEIKPDTKAAEKPSAPKK